jgi:hypothetical protein
MEAAIIDNLYKYLSEDTNNGKGWIEPGAETMEDKLYTIISGSRIQHHNIPVSERLRCIISELWHQLETYTTGQCYNPE